MRFPEGPFFSHDPDWVRKRLSTEAPCRYVDHNARAQSPNDMRLISLCKHQIIANSSFSWWAAWLNAGKEKTVIAPRRWLSVDAVNTEDLLPDRWLPI